MSHHVEVKPTVQTQRAPSDSEPATAKTSVQDGDYSTATTASGNENGGAYFELNWQTGQGQSRRQTLLTTYGEPATADSGGTDSAPTSDAGGGNSYQPTTFGDDGNHHGYVGNLNASSSYGGDGDSPVHSNYYGANSNDSLPPSSTEDSSVPSWNDLVNLISDSRDSSELQNETPNFWREVRRISETKTFQNEDAGETESVSEYDDLLTTMRSEKLSPEEFAETLPPKEREIFKARYQIDQTFGANLFESDGVTLSETAQNHVREVAAETEQIVALPANARLASREGKPIVFSEKFAPESEEIVPVPTRREIGNNAKNAVVFGENTLNRPLPKRIESGEIKLPDKSAQVAVGSNTTSAVIDNGAARTVSNTVSDNSSSVNAIVRRDGGAAQGGALINGSFASIDNFKNAENKAIGNSGSVGNAGFDGGKSSAAGATGTMMSAAVGSLIPGSDAVVGGVVGFISGVVVGVEPDQGLRWLSGERPAEVAPPNYNLNLQEENSFAPNLQLATT